MANGFVQTKVNVVFRTDGGKNAVRVPLDDLVRALESTGIRLPVAPAGGNGRDAEVFYGSGLEVGLEVEKDDASLAAVVSPFENDYPGITLDGTDPDARTLFLAQCELPNVQYPDTITARLYAGYEACETDEPIVFMKHRLLKTHEIERRAKLAGASGPRIRRKLVYVDGDLAEPRPWTSLGDGEACPPEHEPEF